VAEAMGAADRHGAIRTVQSFTREAAETTRFRHCSQV
jgi:hypothetical protein